MPIKVTLSKVLNGQWASEEELAAMTVSDIMDLVQEDLIAFITEAEWSVERLPHAAEGLPETAVTGRRRRAG